MFTRSAGTLSVMAGEDGAGGAETVALAEHAVENQEAARMESTAASCSVRVSSP